MLATSGVVTGLHVVGMQSMDVDEVGGGPAHRRVLLGGQGDVLLAEHLLELLGRSMVACFLHQVVPLSETATRLRRGAVKVTDADAEQWLQAWRQQRIFLADEYVALAAEVCCPPAPPPGSPRTNLQSSHCCCPASLPSLLLHVRSTHLVKSSVQKLIFNVGLWYDVDP